MCENGNLVSETVLRAVGQGRANRLPYAEEDRQVFSDLIQITKEAPGWVRVKMEISKLV